MKTKEVLLNVGLTTVGFLAVGALDKKFCPEKIKKFSGILCIAGGAFLAMKAKNNVLQVLGIGIAVYGVVKQVSELTKTQPTIAAFIPVLGDVPDNVGAIPKLFGQYPEEVAVVGDPMEQIGNLSDYGVNEMGDIEGVDENNVGDIDGIRKGKKNPFFANRLQKKALQPVAEATSAAGRLF